MCLILKLHGAATTFEQKDLVQPAVTMGFQLPIMQSGSDLNRFAMHHIRQVSLFAKKGVCFYMGHVRKIPERNAPVHSRLLPLAAN